MDIEYETIIEKYNAFLVEIKYKVVFKHLLCIFYCFTKLSGEPPLKWNIR